MFLGSALGGPGLNIDPDEGRDPPPEPTPIVFPALQIYSANDGTQRTDLEALPKFQDIFSKISKAADITPEHLRALNIEALPAFPVQDLLPPAPDGTSYLPSLQPPKHVDPYGTTYVDALGSEPKPAGKLLQFHERLAELTVSNDTAYRIITRSTKPERLAPRLAYMRNFYAGLESMSLYWDCSLDQYYEVLDVSDGSRGSPKRQRLDSDSVDGHPDNDGLDRSTGDSKSCGGELQASVEHTNEDTRPCNPTSQLSVESEKATTFHSVEHPQAEENPDERSLGSSSPPLASSRLRYKGRRTATGRDMPDQFRAEAVRSFVEGAAWPFRCTVTAPRHMPMVQFGKLNVPVRQTAAVYRMPNDRIRARQGWVEGPMIALQVRSDTDLDPLDTRSRLDYMREVGGLLQIAQERRREGREQVKPGEGQWWTTKPRWGGGPGGEVQDDIVNSDVVQAAEELLEGLKERRGKDGGRGRRRKTPAMLWKELKCGSGNWDPKTDYQPIGKPGSDFDEVFMISSLNHHISILKLTIHEAYIDSLTSGAPPGKVPRVKEWNRPRLQRTEWFDLFDIEERIVAFQALWGIMSYLTRQPSTPEAGSMVAEAEAETL